MRRQLIYLTILALIFPACATAQVGFTSGDRVRIGRTNGTYVTGVINFVTDDEVSVVVNRGAVSTVVSRTDILEWAKSGGRQRQFVKNFGLTVVSASALVGVLSAVTWSPCTETGFMACFLYPASRGEALSFGAVGGAIIGLPIGVLLGLAIRHEQWDSVEGPWGSALSINPLPGIGVGMSASIALGPASW